MTYEYHRKNGHTPFNSALAVITSSPWFWIGAVVLGFVIGWNLTP